MVKDPVYGHLESNPVPKGYHEQERETIYWDELKGKRNIVATRFRMVSDYGFPMWDVSYLDVTIDGEPYRVEGLPETQFRKARLKGDILDMCKADKIFIKDIVADHVLSKLI